MNAFDDPRVNAGAYALNALDTDERHLYENYCAESELARIEADEFAVTAAAIATTISPVAPSPELKVRIMAQLVSNSQNDEAALRPGMTAS